jgi:hypothetical protein
MIMSGEAGGTNYEVRGTKQELEGMKYEVVKQE